MATELDEAVTPSTYCMRHSTTHKWTRIKQKNDNRDQDAGNKR